MFENLDDPRKQALLALAAGLLSPVRGKGWSGFGEAASQGINAGLLGFNQAQRTQEAVKRGEMERQLEQARLAQMKQAQDAQAYKSAGIGKFMSPGSAGVPYNDSIGDGTNGFVRPPQPLSFDREGYAKYLAENPATAESALNFLPQKKLEKVGDYLVDVTDPNAPKTSWSAPEKAVTVNTGNKVLRVGERSGTQMGSYDVGVSPDARYQGGVTMRGQDKTDARARESNAIAAGNKVQEITHQLRKEFNGLQEVQAYKNVVPVVEAARSAPDTPAGDLALIYGVGKVLDPNSVVREGEMNLVMAAGSPAQRVMGYWNVVTGGGRLTPAQRKELQAVMDDRASQYAAQYEAQKNTYSELAKKSGASPDMVISDLPRGSVAPATKQIVLGGKKTEARRAPDGKYYIKRGDKYYEVEE